jgi:hypothetical protein
MHDLAAARDLLDEVLQARQSRLGEEHADTRRARELLMDVPLLIGVQADEATLVPELHQDAAMDDYGDALERPVPPRQPAAASNLWPRTPEELLALDLSLSGARGTPR